jgi:hypothetical protein
MREVLEEDLSTEPYQACRVNHRTDEPTKPRLTTGTTPSSSSGYRLDLLLRLRLWFGLNRGLPVKKKASISYFNKLTCPSFP